MKFELLTNEWLPANGNKWLKREVLIRYNDGEKVVGFFNGFYWCGQDGHRLVETVGHKITHFYIFERDIEDNLPLEK